MASIHDGLSAIADLVESPDFRDSQESFFQQHCFEFSAGDQSTENKLGYTAIHNNYIALVEEQIGASIGQDLLDEVMRGLAQYLAETKDQPELKDEGVARTLEVLESMADYESFKQTMLQKRSAGGASRIRSSDATIEPAKQPPQQPRQSLPPAWSGHVSRNVQLAVSCMIP